MCTLKEVGPEPMNWVEMGKFDTKQACLAANRLVSLCTEEHKAMEVHRAGIAAE